MSKDLTDQAQLQKEIAHMEADIKHLKWKLAVAHDEQNAITLDYLENHFLPYLKLGLK